jgi:hypothetical protein
MPAPWQPPDLDEIKPGRFIIHNEKVRPFLRGEGEREGVFFQLGSWRREGWVARLRMAGFNVRTLDDRVEALPEVKGEVVLGPEGLRSLATARERIAAWDPERLRWHDLPIITADGRPAVRLRVNEPLRRRKSRGGGDFFIAVLERPERIGLKPVKETAAIMQAYAILVASGHPPILSLSKVGDGYNVAADQALLPEPHREALDLLASDGAPRWTFSADELPHARRVFEKLGIEMKDEG